MADKKSLERLLRRVDVPRVSASDAKNQFGQMLESALAKGAVVITKHDTPKAVLLSIDELEAIAGRSKLGSLAAELDQMVADMQRPEVKVAVAAAFDATPEELGEAAVKAARRKR